MDPDPTMEEGRPGNILSARLKNKSLRTVAKFANQPIPVSVTFGNATGTRAVYATGVTKARYHRTAGGTLHAVTLVAAPDVTPPVVKFTPAAVADPDLFGVDFLGSVQDMGRPTYADLTVFGLDEGLGEGEIELGNQAPKIEIRVNGVGITDDEGNDIGGYPVEYTDAFGELLGTPGFEGGLGRVSPNEAGYYRSFGYVGTSDTNPNYSYYGIGVLNSLGLGYFGGFADLTLPTNTVTITATDADGNATVVTKQIKGVPISEFPQPFAL
jgi:hypothetical protein